MSYKTCMTIIGIDAETRVTFDHNRKDGTAIVGLQNEEGCVSVHADLVALEKLAFTICFAIRELRGDDNEIDLGVGPKVLIVE